MLNFLAAHRLLNISCFLNCSFESFLCADSFLFRYTQNPAQVAAARLKTLFAGLKFVLNREASLVLSSRCVSSLLWSPHSLLTSLFSSLPNRCRRIRLSS